MITRAFCVFLGILISSTLTFAQTVLYAVEDGGWTTAVGAANDIWNTDPFAAEGLAGVRPSALDDVFTNGRTITVGSGAICKNLGVTYDQAGKLIFSGLLTITGTLAGWDDASGVPTAPSVNVFSGNPLIRYTAANLDGTNPFFLSSSEVIGFWNKNTPLGQGLFAITQNCVIDGGDSFFGGDSELQFTSINLSGGNQYELSTGGNLTGIRISGISGTTFVIASNTRFATTVPVYGTGAASSMFASNTTINGYLQTSSYFNGTNVRVTSTGTIATTFTGSDQTQGWWYQNSTPAITLDNGSTVTFSATANQNVYRASYSNLVLSGSGVKSLAGTSGQLILSRSLTISSSVTFDTNLATQVNIGGNLICDGTWQPSIPIVFNGASPVTAQSISGSGTLNLNSLQISNVGISLLLSKSGLTISNGIIVSSNANLNLGAQTVTISGGDFSNSGTVASGSGTLAFTSAGVTDFTGIGTTSLNNVTVSNGDLIFQSVVSLNNLTVSNAAAAVTFSSSPTINGNIANSGDLDFPTSAVLTFGGGSAQSISGNGFSVYDMVVNKSANTLSNNTTINLLGNLTMTSGTFDADGGGGGNFVLISDENRDATIGEMAGGIISGEVTFQRYYDNTGKAWRNLGFPVTSVSIADLSGSFTIHNKSISYYQESSPGDINQGWSYLADGNLLNKYGYSVYMYDIRPITISVKGPLLQNRPADLGSQYDFGVTYTNDATQPASENGWNLVANPFACPADWNDDSNWIKTNVNAVAYVWDATSKAYRASGTAGWNGVIAQGQAIWVQTNASSPSLQCYEGAKRADVLDPSFFRVRTESVSEKSKMSSFGRLSVFLEDGEVFDEAIVQFEESAKPEFDTQFDAYKLPNQIFNISSLTPSGADFAINVQSKSSCTERVKLKVSNIRPGSYTLRFDGLSTFGNAAVSIRDNFTNKTVSLTDGYVYEFSVTDDGSSYGKDRFELHFGFENPDSIVPAITQTGRKLTTNATGDLQWFYNGVLLRNETGQSLIASKTGEYHVEATNDGCITKSSALEVLQSSSFKSYPNPALDELHVDVVGLLSDGESHGTIILYSSKGEVIVSERFDKSDDIKLLDLKSQKPGVYLLKIFSGAKLVEDERIVIK